MSFTPRLKQMLQVMLREDKPISGNLLAQKVGISKRTVQRELDYMDSSLKKYPVVFQRKTGVGMWIEGTPEEKQSLLAELEDEDSYDVSNREERRKRLLLAILKDKEPKKLYYYSNEFEVSEATISKDLDAIEKWLAEYKLIIIRKPGSGIQIQGTEENYRRAIRHFINDNMDTQMLRDFYEEDATQREQIHIKKTGLGNVIDEDILQRVVDTIVEMEDERIRTLTESSYVGLVLHIAIAIARIMKKEIIEENKELIRSMDKDQDFELAKNIVEDLEDEFSLDIPEMEIYYICLHIKGSKHQKINLEQDRILEIEKKDLQRMLNEMIDAFDKEKAFLLKQDEDFIQGLLAHIQPTVIRIMYGMQIHNPVLSDIKQNYPDIFGKCQKVGEVLELWLGTPIPEAEVGFLTVHFGAALVRLENKKESIRRVNVGIVCASGIGISRLMASKLERTFKDRVILKTYGKHDITPYVGKNTDFFVSSISMDQADLEVVSVSPLLNDSDMEKIEQKIFYYERTQKRTEESEAEEDTKFSEQLEKVNYVASQIKQLIRYFHLYQVEEDISFEDLVKRIGKDMAHYSDWEQCIETDLLNRERMGTQIFAEFGFALLHARTKGVIRSSIAIYMTKDKSPFSNDYFKRIPIVFVMLLPEDEHVRVNSEIIGHISSTLIEDVTFLDFLMETDQEGMREILSKCLKGYFEQYLNKM